MASLAAHDHKVKRQQHLANKHLAYKQLSSLRVGLFLPLSESLAANSPVTTLHKESRYTMVTAHTLERRQEAVLMEQNKVLRQVPL